MLYKLALARRPGYTPLHTLACFTYIAIPHSQNSDLGATSLPLAGHGIPTSTSPTHPDLTSFHISGSKGWQSARELLGITGFQSPLSHNLAMASHEVIKFL